MPNEYAARIKRIDEIGAPARTAWFTLMGVLAFVAVTLLSITHADILLATRMISLPVVGVSVPTNLFLVLTPIVVTVLYTNLHLYLLKLWQAFRRAPTDAELGEGEAVAELVQPWLVNDYALTLKNGTTPGDHRRTAMRNAITLFTVWWAPLLVLGWMWYTALLTRELGVILVILACLVVCALIGLHSWMRAHHWLRQQRGQAGPILAHVVLFALAGLGLLASRDATLGAGEAPVLAGVPGLPHRLGLDYADLVGGSVQGAAAQRTDFRNSWCTLAKVPNAICGSVPAATPYETNLLILARRSYCRTELGIDGANLVKRCDGHFLDLDRKFDAAWSEVRREKITSGPRIDLSARNLAGASAASVNLTGARLENASLAGAQLPNARLEGADLKEADLSGIQAYYANLSYANLTSARIDKANLESANLRGAILRGAQASGTLLSHADLVAADLTGADLRGADLSHARLHRANLEGALIAGAKFKEATGLTQAQLDQALGDASTTLTAPRVVLPRPRVIEPDDRPLLTPYHVATCWREPPEDFVALKAAPGTTNAYKDELDAIAKHLCTDPVPAAPVPLP